MGKKKDKKATKGASAVVTESRPSVDVENEGSADHLVPRRQHGGAQILEQQEKNLSRSLLQRHIQMIALAGTIGGSSSASLDSS
jgi:amino acid permease